MTERPAILRPNRDDILAHLEALFGRAMKGEIEIAWSETDTGAVKHAQLFPPDDLDAIADFAVDLNAKAGVNVYVGMATRLANTPPFGRTDDADYATTYAVAADLDDAGGVEQARSIYEKINLRPSFVVVTGEHPHPRAQLWFSLEDPFANAAIHREIQTGLAALFHSDDKIVNPGRIMRVAGTIAWPKKPGRVTELTAFYPASGAEYPVARLRKIAQDAIADAPGKAGESGLGLDAYKPGLDIAEQLARLQQPGEWHDAALRVTASLVGKGLPDEAIYAMAPAMTMPGYTVEQTLSQLRVMVRGARAKNFTPEIAAPQPEPVTEAEREAIAPALFTPWQEINPALIPRIKFVYSDFYAAGYTSLTVAPPKVGKSLLALAEAVDIASGKGFLSGVPRDPQVVVYYNAEDDQNVINARVAAICDAYRIPQSAIAGRLFATSGVEREDFFFIEGDKGVINERQFIAIEKFCVEQSADALIFDPLQDLSRSPETNEVFRLLGQRIRRLASITGVAMGLVHHTRKLQPGASLTIDDARGGGALRGTSRFNRLLVPMSEDEAAKAGEDNHHHFFRIGDIETNLAPPSSERTQWFQKLSVEIANGQSVGVVQKWRWPDAFAGITAEDARRVRALVDAQTTPPRADVRAAQWVGHLIANALKIDADDKAQRERIKALLAGWIKADVLRETTERSPRDGRDVAIVVCGANTVKDT